MKSIFLCVVPIFLFTVVHAQNVAINNDASSANASAMLDVKSLNKGLLIPRVALTGSNDVATIVSPAVSLLVFNTATVNGVNAVSPGFYYWNGTAWMKLVVNLDLNSATWSTSGNSATTANNFLGTTDNVGFNIRVNNQRSARIDSSTQSSFYGYPVSINYHWYSEYCIGISNFES